MKDRKTNTDLYKLKIKNEIELEIVNCEILNQQVDVIINPVDPELTFQEGLSK